MTLTIVSRSLVRRPIACCAVSQGSKAIQVLTGLGSYIVCIESFQLSRKVPIFAFNEYGSGQYALHINLRNKTALFWPRGGNYRTFGIELRKDKLFLWLGDESIGQDGHFSEWVLQSFKQPTSDWHEVHLSCLLDVLLISNNKNYRLMHKFQICGATIAFCA